MPQDPAHLSLQEFTGALEQCLGQTFDEPVRLEAADEPASLPPVLKAGYRFFSTKIAGRPCFLMTAQRGAQVPPNLTLHVSLLRAAVDAVVIVAAPALGANRALSLVKEGVSFAVPGHVPHIPELGSDLRTYGDAPIPRDTDGVSVNDEAWVFPFLPHSA